jgi:hypothetical protein
VALAGDQAISPTLVYGGNETIQRKNIRVLNWNAVGNILDHM